MPSRRNRIPVSGGRVVHGDSSESIYNLTVGQGDSTLWTALLSSSLVYLLPNPSMKCNNGI